MRRANSANIGCIVAGACVLVCSSFAQSEIGEASPPQPVQSGRSLKTGPVLPTGSLETPSGRFSRETARDALDRSRSAIHNVRCDAGPRRRSRRGRVACADIEIAYVRVTDQGEGADGDRIPDDGEDIRLDLAVVNRTVDADGQPVDLEGVMLTIRTFDPDVGCLVDARSALGDLPFGQARENNAGDPFRFVVGRPGRTQVGELHRAVFSLGVRAHYTDNQGRPRRVLGLTVPRHFALDLDLDVVGGQPLTADDACVGGTAAGHACATVADCPGGLCEALPAYLAAGGASAVAGRIGFFEGFEGADHEGGRADTGAPIPGTNFEHLPGLNAGGGFLERFVRDTLGRGVLEGLTPGSSPGNLSDLPQGSSATDGVRCQFNDPQGAAPQNRSESSCRLWDGSDWAVTSSKAASGGRSLRMGLNSDPGPPVFDIDTYHTNQLSAAFTPPIHVAVGGGAVLSAQQIASLADDRSVFLPDGQATDRAYVQAVEVDPATGVPLRGWSKLAAFQNGYASRAVQPWFNNCVFDPYDDFYDAAAALGETPGFNPLAANTVGARYNDDGVSSEDDYFDPNDPLRTLGPSSGCFPQFVFSGMGSYSGSDPGDVGRAETTGSPGSTGTGIWVNSLFSLDAFAGRTIRVRFVTTGIDINVGGIWPDLFGSSLEGVRGWNLDDIAISGVADAPLAFIPDTREPPPGLCSSLDPRR